MGSGCKEPWKVDSLNIMHQNRRKNRGQCFSVKLVKEKAAKIILAAGSPKCVLLYEQHTSENISTLILQLIFFSTMKIKNKTDLHQLLGHKI